MLLEVMFEAAVRGLSNWKRSLGQLLARSSSQGISYCICKSICYKTDFAMTNDNMMYFMIPLKLM